MDSNNIMEENKPTPIEPKMVNNIDTIPDWHPKVLEKSRNRDPVVRLRNIALNNNRMQVRSTPTSFKNINIMNVQSNLHIENELLNDINQNQFLNQNNNSSFNNNNNVDNSFDDMNENSSESNSTNDSELSLIEWMNNKQKKSYSVPRNFERINLSNDNSPSASPRLDSKKSKIITSIKIITTKIFFLI